VPRATTGHALLGLIALRPGWSTYELTGQVRRALRFLWPRAESRLYDEARALDERGLVRALRADAGQRRRTVYELTPDGRSELQRWLATPPAASRLECEALLRVLLGRLSGTDQLLDAVRQVRADGDGIVEQGRAVAAEYLTGAAPFQDDVVYRSLVFDFLSRYAAMLRAWADDTEATVDRWSALRPEEQAAEALERIRAGIARFPAS
jgi:DNA-binding PadR family transcriptional regulator